MSWSDYWGKKMLNNKELIGNDEAKMTITIKVFKAEMKKAFLAGQASSSDYSSTGEYSKKTDTLDDFLNMFK